MSDQSAESPVFSSLSAARRLLAACAIAVLPLSPALADSPEQVFRVHGFGTLGTVKTNASGPEEFVRDLSQPRGAGNEWTSKLDSVLGLQANWQLTPELQVVAQGITRYRYDESFRPELSWAFLQVEPQPNLSLRVGRLGTEFFMLADSRWVGYSFLTVRPPGDYFWYLPFYTIHGADAAMSFPVGDSMLRAKLFYGLSQGNVPLASEQWKSDGSPMVGGYLEYQAASWQVRASYANIRFKRDLPLAEVVRKEQGYTLSAGQLDYLQAKDQRAHYYSLGMVYDRGPWQAQLMLNRIDQESKALESSSGGYALVGYRMGEFTPYLGYSKVRSKSRSVPSGTTPIDDLIMASIMQYSHADQHTTFGGLRWDLASNLALKAQWDAIRGDKTSAFPYRNEAQGRWAGKMDVFSLSLDFVF